MNRRAVLASCALSLAGIAGCTRAGAPTDESETASPTASSQPTTSTEQTTALDQESVQVAFERLQPGVGVARHDDIVIRGGSGTQYLYLSVAVDAGDPPPRPEFAFRFGGSSYAPVDPNDVGEFRLARTASDAYPDPYTRERGEGWLLFEIPATGDAVGAALTVWDREWTPENLPRDRVESPLPTLSTEWQAPATTTYGSDGEATVELEFAVTNTGAHDGQFVAALNRSDFVNTSVGLVTEEIPAGETVRWTVADTISYIDSLAGDSPEAEYTLQLVGERRERKIDLVQEE